jgi:hypothetical protein
MEINLKHLLRVAIVLTGLGCVSADVSAGIVIAENTGGTVPNLAGYFGQSFLTAAGGPYVGITFNFFETPR